MARFSRVVLPEVPHHVTQRGNGRQVAFLCDEDRITYVELLRKYSAFHGLGLLGYCLMSNHVHLVVVPHALDSFSQTLKHVHGRYAAYWNAKRSASGHLWQGRFYSCPLEEGHLWEALRYVELNPVRAKLVAAPEQWRWSSAAAHCTGSCSDGWLEMERWRR